MGLDLENTAIEIDWHRGLHPRSMPVRSNGDSEQFGIGHTLVQHAPNTSSTSRLTNRQDRADRVCVARALVYNKAVSRCSVRRGSRLTSTPPPSENVVPHGNAHAALISAVVGFETRRAADSR
jgi:hypothetical protein